jgi:predicted AAA+ superfamily ATPase
MTGENQKSPVIIDEIQKLPLLLDEIHWLIENKGLRFILCGSSARKLKKGHANLLGGRAVRHELFPFIYKEIPNFSLDIALNRGLIPKIYLSANHARLLQSYTGDYLKEEIAAEALTRNIPAFSRFLEIAALSNGEIINYNNIAAECGVSAPTIKEYYQILCDTLLGRFVPSFRKRAKRRIIQASKFYFFDVGIISHLTRRHTIIQGSELFGKAFEQYIYMEISAHSSYSEKFYPVYYLRTTSGFEVDFILGDMETAIEVKSSAMIRDHHLKNIRALKEESKARRFIIVSMDKEPRKTPDDIEIMPWEYFLNTLWDGAVI